MTDDDRDDLEGLALAKAPQLDVPAPHDADVVSGSDKFLGVGIERYGQKVPVVQADPDATKERIDEEQMP